MIVVDVLLMSRNVHGSETDARNCALPAARLNKMYRSSLGTRRRGKQRAVGGHGWGIGRNGGDDEGDGGGAKGFSGGNQEFGEGIFWGQNPIRDSEDYNEWLEEEWSEERMEMESKELELEKEEYREFLKGLREKQVEKPVVVENKGEKNN